MKDTSYGKTFTREEAINGTQMLKPITIVYDWKDIGRRSYTCNTYEDYHRVVRLLHENENEFTVVSVKRG